ncbi:MAG: hypothetical protein ABR548_01695 [Actinomycetota bacterium]
MTKQGLRRWVIALVVGGTTFGGVYGFAAPAGTRFATLGRGRSPISACQQESIGVSFAPTGSAMTVTLTNVNTKPGGFGGLSFMVALLDKENAPIEKQSGMVPRTGTTASVAFSSVNAADVTGVQVTIAG